MSSYRVDKLASAIREIISDAIAHKLNDPRISPLTSITRVEVSGDLQVVKVLVSVMGDAVQGRTTLAGLTSAVGHIQRLVAGKVQMRRCPELRFVLDESLKKAADTMRLIDRTLAEDALCSGQETPPEFVDPDTGDHSSN
ncbi:MAG: 30S ribosome-binding factor RbfA [Phycisphaerae bacterium]